MSYTNLKVSVNALEQMIEACDSLLDWSDKITDVEDYHTSSEGMMNLAGSCMLIEAIGEGLKKIDAKLPGFLDTEKPGIEWKKIKGMRDHIAHGYFEINSDHVFFITKNQIVPLRQTLVELKDILIERIYTEGE